MLAHAENLKKLGKVFDNSAGASPAAGGALHVGGPTAPSLPSHLSLVDQIEYERLRGLMGVSQLILGDNYRYLFYQPTGCAVA